MNQEALILKHIRKNGSISQREALIDYSIQCLTARIHTLRKRGFKIKTLHKQHPVTGQKYARYVL
jgi:hypothetical protein